MSEMPGVIVRAAVEPTVGIPEVGPQDLFRSIVRGAAGCCVIVDPSASWGRGVEVSSGTLKEFENLLRAEGPGLGLEASARKLEQASFAARSKVDIEEGTDTFFSATLVATEGPRARLAWAGDILAAVCNPQGITWVTWPNYNAAASGAAHGPVAPRPAPWFPGLLGCTPEQRSVNLLERAGAEVDLTNGDALMLFSASVWSYLDDASVLAEVRRPVAAPWQQTIHERVLRIAKQRGAKGYRAVAALSYASSLETEESPLGRSAGYRAYRVEEGTEVRFTLEEQETHREILRAYPPSLKDRTLLVRYEHVSRDLNDATARAILFELLLEKLLGGFRSAAEHVRYLNMASGRERTIGYGWPTT